jgi:hypothetical protein
LGHYAGSAEREDGKSDEREGELHIEEEEKD